MESTYMLREHQPTPSTWHLARGLSLLAAALLLASACSKKNTDSTDGESESVHVPHDCNAVGVKLAEFTMVQTKGLKERQAKLVGAQLQMMKESTVNACNDESWSVDIRRCMATATDLDGFNQCTAPLREAKGLPPPSRGPSSKRPPVAIPPGALERALDPAPGTEAKPATPAPVPGTEAKPATPAPSPAAATP